MEPSLISLMFGIATVFVAVLAAATWVVRRQHQRQKRAQGVIWLQALRSMLMHIQRHRGLSTTVLGGDMTLAPILEEAQRNVSRDLGHITLVGEWIKDNPNWAAITAHWARLAGQYQRLDVRKNLDQHNKLIHGILVFIDDVAKEHYLADVPLEQVSWRYLLSIAEQLGQIRAVGLAYIACIERSENAPRLRNSLQSLLAEFMVELEKPEFNEFIPSKQRDKILQFIVRFPEALLENPHACPLKQYYQTATGVMDDLYSQFDEELQLVLHSSASSVR
ncbi:MAG TPA: nitrate- and nitrite sensing domain-containing protein [Marinagarivorans sp.]